MEIVMPELVETIEQVVENAIIFNSEIKNYNSGAFKTFGKFSNWFYFSNLNIFAPNKYIGYQRFYDAEYTKDGHGSETKTTLIDIGFKQVHVTEPQFKTLENKLVNFAAKMAKKIHLNTFTANGGGGIYIYDKDIPDIKYPDENGKHTEGHTTKILVNKYERNQKARKECIDHHGYSCKACKTNFEELYGDIGKGFIHVHHLIEISSIKEEYEINPINDLIPLCPNCHAMAHKNKPALSIDELKQILKSEKIKI